jgi:hypothetical protein
MKNGKRPTRRQMKAIESAGLNLENWLVSKALSDELLLVHKWTGQTRRLPL